MQPHPFSFTRYTPANGANGPDINTLLTMQGGVELSDVDKPSWWRSATPPLNWPTAGGKRCGRVTLPEHLSWSGPSSSSTFDLDDPAELRVVYATVLREGSQDDVREWIHQATLLAIWDSLWLPPAVHEAWDGWSREHLVHVAV